MTSMLLAGFEGCIGLQPSCLQSSEYVNVPTRDDITHRAWWVLHTKPRQEKALACDLRRMDVDIYLPLVRHHRNNQNRRLEVSIPLFPGYVFMCGSVEDRLAVLSTRRVVRTLEVVDQNSLESDLRRIDRLLMSGSAVSAYAGLKVGKRCRVKSGPLSGLEGVVLRRRDVSRMYIGMELLGQSGVVEIDSLLLEPIG